MTIGVAVAAVVVVLPIVYLVIRAGEGGWGPVSATLIRRQTLDLAVRSVLLALAVTGASLLIGVTGAWLVTRSDLPGRAGFRVMLAMPLAVPSYVAAWAWIGIGPHLAGPVGAFIVLTSVSYPFVYLPVAAALRRCDPELDDAARMLGRGQFAVVVGVTLRQARTAAVGGGLLVGLYTLSDFGAVSIMRFQSLTHAIYRSYRASFDRTPAAVLGCLLVGIALLVLFAQRRAIRPDHVAKVGGGSPRRPTIVSLGRWRWPVAVGVAAFMGCCLGVPAWSLVYWLRRGTSTTDWAVLADASLTTFWIAACGAVVTLVIAVPVGVASARYAGRLSASTTNAAYAAHALPGIVIALSLVFFGIRFATPIYQRLPMLIFAYVVLFVSLAIGAVHNSVAQAPRSLDEMARMLGRSQWGAWRSVTMRLSAPGLGAGALLVFLTVMKELPATLLLRPIGIDTLATRLWGYTDSSSFAAAAPFAAAIVVLAVIPAAALTASWSD